MTRAFQTTYKLTLDDFKALSAAYTRRTLFRRVNRWLNNAIIVALGGATGYFALIADWKQALYFAALTAVVLALRLVVTPWMQRRQFIQQRIGEHDITLHGDEDGFSVTTPLSEGRHQWQMIRHLDDLPEHVIMWPTNRIGWIIPKRAFASRAEAEAFTALVKEKSSGQSL